MKIHFTLVSTIFNEAKRLQESIDDIEKQTLPPNEVVVVDAGSQDGTRDILKNWQKNSEIKVVIIVKEGCNVAEGRNIAIKKAKYDLIVSTDFGCRYHVDWLHDLVSPFKNAHVKVVAGNFSVSKEMLTSKASKAAFILANGYVNRMDESFIPSSRSIAYYKEAWSKVGGYPEWVTLAGDDTHFGYELKKVGYSFHLATIPRVFWGRHLDASAYDKEAFRYGIGDGETQDNVNRKNIVIKLMELVMRIGFIAILIFSIFNKFTILGSLLLLLLLFGFRPYFKALRFWLKSLPEFGFIILINAFIMLETNRWFYLRGYLKGLRN